MSFMAAQQEHNRRASASHDRKPSDSSEEGTLAAFGRIALNSLRAGELPHLDAFLSSKDDDDDESMKSSDGMSSRDFDSPPQHGKEFDSPRADPRDAGRDPRDGRRKVRFMGRLVHR